MLLFRVTMGGCPHLVESVGCGITMKAPGFRDHTTRLFKTGCGLEYHDPDITWTTAIDTIQELDGLTGCKPCLEKLAEAVQAQLDAIAQRSKR